MISIGKLPIVLLLFWCVVSVLAQSKPSCDELEEFPAACLNYSPPPVFTKNDPQAYACMTLIHHENPAVRACIAEIWALILERTSGPMVEVAEADVEQLYAQYPCEFLQYYSKGSPAYKEHSLNLLVTVYRRDLDERVAVAMSKVRQSLKQCSNKDAKFFVKEFENAWNR